MNILPLSADNIAKMIKNRVPFTFSRFGDGEWNAILGKRPGKANTDRQPYDNVAADLVKVLTDKPGYMLGLQPLAVRLYDKEIEDWLAQRSLAGLKWYNSDCFHAASRKNELEPLLKALAIRDVIQIGPPHLDALKLFPVRQRIRVPGDGQAQTRRDEVTKQAIAAAACFAEPVFVVSAGMTAKWIIHHLFKSVANITIVDTGAVWDPYVGVKSRSYHQGIMDRIKGC